MKDLPQDNLTPDVVVTYVSRALAEECLVVEADGREAIVPLRKGLSALKLSAFSALRTTDGSLADLFFILPSRLEKINANRCSVSGNLGNFNRGF